VGQQALEAAVTVVAEFGDVGGGQGKCCIEVDEGEGELVGER
jgi:L-aminopeptidase/D-esterase-like protein